MPSFLRENKKPIIFLALIFFHLILISLQVPLGYKQSLFEKAVFGVFSPFQRLTSSALRGAGNFWSRYLHLGRVEEENQRMRKELFFLRQQVNFLKDSLLRFRTEREIEALLSRVGSSIIVSRVIGLDASNYFRSIIINKGRLDGVKKDMVVLDKFGNLVGRVVDPVSLDESRVQLVTDTESGVSVYCGPERSVGVASGDGQGRCLVKYILASAKDAQPGDEIITSGFDHIFPSGVKVGKVLSSVQDTSLFKKILIEPMFRHSEIDEVAILTADIKHLF